MKFGLKDEVITNICNVFSNFAEIEKVIIYGSRAKGNYKNGSDIDLTLFGDGLEYSILSKLDFQLEELYLPYTFDISIFNMISNADLKEHISSVGQVFYDNIYDNIEKNN